MNQSLRCQSMGRHLFPSLLFFTCLFPLAAMATPASDDFIRGYATAILQRDFQVTAETLSVHSGVVTIRGLEASDVVQDQIQTSLSAIEGVSQVVVAKEGERTPTGGG